MWGFETARRRAVLKDEDYVDIKEYAEREKAYKAQKKAEGKINQRINEREKARELRTAPQNNAVNFISKRIGTGTVAKPSSSFKKGLTKSKAFEL